MKRAVVLISGGLDSATVLAIAREARFDCYALSFNYGQRHAVELEAARRVVAAIGAVEHCIAQADFSWIGGSALTADIPVPKDRPVEEMAGDVPITYIPARNTIFFSYALAWAEVLGATDIFTGANALDYSGYPDCRPEFLIAFENMARLGTRAGVLGAEIRVHAPLIQMTKAKIIREGVRLGVDYAITHSCYDPDGEGRACGHCDSCQLRRRGFALADVPDPTRYAP